jgi:hypothetical protein
MHGWTLMSLVHHRCRKLGSALNSSMSWASDGPGGKIKSRPSARLDELRYPRKLVAGRGEEEREVLAKLRHAVGERRRVLAAGEADYLQA